MDRTMRYFEIVKSFKPFTTMFPIPGLLLLFFLCCMCYASTLYGITVKATENVWTGNIEYRARQESVQWPCLLYGFLN
ncbi:unnamed protein product [Linum trigynum]|uniref:Uncharacterized protein n=1 Tax=Linum trigynum TaxID=586398 RepID=A0AAV2DD65_9ROSI